jgi:hypothetical protein
MPLKPSLYYPGGGGGNWLNYLIWCGLNQQNANHDILEFSLANIKENVTQYFRMIPHLQYTSPADVRLGSNRALINFYINVCVKNPNWTGVEPGGYIQMKKHDWNWNLDYCDIFLDPEKFIKQLNNLTGLDLKLDPCTEFAFKQYIDSCPWTALSEQELLETTWVKDSWHYCFQHQTSSRDSIARRTNQAWQEVRSMLLILK